MSLIKAKRILALLLVLLMAAGLTACGAKESNQGGKVEVVVAKPDDKEPEPEPSWWELNVKDNPDLILVNKTHPLDADYWPDDMVTIERHVEGVGNADTHQMKKVAADALNAMFDAAEKDGIYLKLRTGFRSYKYQENLFASYVKNNGEEKANTFSARAGQSEHQSGLCCDVGGKSQGYALSYEFGKTDEGKWVAAHCAEYGFIIRYTEGKEDITGYVAEPWHIRYVGAEHAKNIVEQNYTLEEYLGSSR
ncbi:MAG: M15 family metallopeptidase [Firmicutes bacterium]|nr:M15 family metallopeptidase [Bacillota bacterium]